MNTELALAALEDAKEHPENFDMESYFNRIPAGGIVKTDSAIPPLCGTTACYAGFASLRAAPIGTRIVDGPSGSTVIHPDGTETWVEDYAVKVLGITDGQAGALFYLENIEQVERVVRHLISHPDADQEDLWSVADSGVSE